MLRLVIFIFFSFLFAPSNGQIAGRFKTNFPTYGTFEETIKLNCDNSAIMYFKGDLMNDSSVGVWQKNGNLLTLKFDPVLYPEQRHKGSLQLEIRNKGLYRIFFTKAQFKQLKAKSEQYPEHGADGITLTSYRAFKKRFMLTPKNYYGKNGLQYYKLMEYVTCN